MAFQEANWSPTFTLTEDFALGMYLKANKWHCRYVEEYLAIGEAPDQVRNCFQQRSRWCKVGGTRLQRCLVSCFCMLPWFCMPQHPADEAWRHRWCTLHALAQPDGHLGRDTCMAACCPLVGADPGTR